VDAFPLPPLRQLAPRGLSLRGDLIVDFNDMTGVFISYREEDAKPWALLLRKELAEVFGDKWVFLDKDTLHAGNWRTQIYEALNQCRVVLVVIGRHWLTITDETGLRRLNRSDDVHRQEIALALSRKEVTVIPVRVDGVAMPRAEDLPSDIRSLSDQQSRELSDTSGRRELDMQLLIEEIRRITGLESKRRERTSLKVGLKAFLLTTVTIVALTLAVSMFFYITPPREPLTPAETTVVLGASTAVVLAAKRIWARLRKDR
jgi:TIR domain